MEGGGLILVGRRLGFLGETLGGVAEGTDEVVEAFADRRRVLESSDYRLGIADDLVADLGDPALPLGDEIVGAAARVVEVALRLLGCLAAETAGLTLDGVENRADPA